MLLGSPQLACQKEAVANQSAPQQSGVAAAEALAKPAASSRFDEPAFSLSIAPKGQPSRGQPAEFVIVLSAKAPFHVNKEYPHRFKVTTARGLTTTSNVIQRDPSKVSPERLELDVPAKLGQDGPFGIEGEMSFSLCTDEKCLMEKRQLAAPLTVN